MLPPPPSPTLFPYTTLFRSASADAGSRGRGWDRVGAPAFVHLAARRSVLLDTGDWDGGWRSGDRKSTRLNSSHRCISYAVFCLKKKKNTILDTTTVKL